MKCIFKYYQAALAAVILTCSLYCKGYSQNIKLHAAGLEFLLPNNSWQLTDSASSPAENKARYIFERNLTADQNKTGIRPMIAFVVEKLNRKMDIMSYSLEKRNQAPFNVDETFSPDDKNAKIIFKNAVGYKSTTKGRFNSVSIVYFVHLVNDNTGIQIICEAPESTFDKYNNEFISALRSLKKSGPAEIKNKGSISPDKANTADKKSTTNTSKGNCTYFPLKNGMKFTYRRTNMLGVHTIMETYAEVKAKTMKSGRVVKGFKISSDDENRNDVVMYYYCENGSVKMYSEMPEYNTYFSGYEEDESIFPSEYNKPDYKKTPIFETEKYGSGKFLTFTELGAGAKGTEWTDIQVANGNPVTIKNRIEETGLTITIAGKPYSSVIHVFKAVSINHNGQTLDINTQDVYYAPGVGKIKSIEKGKDFLFGDYVTSQELVSYSIPK